MDKNLIARASISVNVSSEKVWNALVTPEAIKQYMFGTDVVSEWEEGSPITWKGEWQGKSYEDKGVILKFKPRRTIQYSHFSPLSGLPDKQENYHTVTIELSGDGNQTVKPQAITATAQQGAQADSLRRRFAPTSLAT